MNFPSSDVLNVVTIEDDLITVSWYAIASIPQSDSSSYGYRLEYKERAGSGSYTLTEDEAHISGQTYRVTIPNLVHNRYYTIRLRPFRIYRGDNVYGNSISLDRKTRCIGMNTIA